jgi:hypothetical protein
MNNNIAELGRPHQFKPRQGGNLNGRPVGSRTAFSQAYIADFAQV